MIFLGQGSILATKEVLLILESDLVLAPNGFREVEEISHEKVLVRSQI
jgi:hypothetical protein